MANWWQWRGPAAIVFCMHALFTANNGLLLELSKRGGAFPFSLSTLPILVEIGKLLVTVVLLIYEQQSVSRAYDIVTNVKRDEMVWYAAPAAIYAVSNTANLFAYVYLPAVDVYILSQLKVLFTTLFSKLVFGTDHSKVRSLLHCIYLRRYIEREREKKREKASL